MYFPYFFDNIDMKTIILVITSILTFSATLSAHLDLREYQISPTTIKKVGIYQTVPVKGKSADLFFEFQKRLTLELQSTFWFDVYDYERIMETITQFSKDDPPKFLYSLDALIIVDVKTNGTLHVGVNFPARMTIKDFEFKLRKQSDLDKYLGLIRTELEKRLYLSGEIISLRPENRAIINLGKNFNIQKRDLFISFRSNTYPSAILKVEHVNDLTSIVKILWQQENILETDTVVPANPDLLKNLKSKYTSIDIRNKLMISNPTRVPSIDNTFVSFLPQVHKNAFIISDSANTFYFNLDNDRQYMLEKNRYIDKMKWRPNAEQTAYSVSNSLVIYDIARQTKLLLQQFPEPAFIISQLIFDTKTPGKILDFIWDNHGKNFVFFVQGAGLFLTQDFKNISKIEIPTLYKDSKTVQLGFSGNDETLYIKTPNNFNSLSTIHSYEIGTGSVKRLPSIRSKNNFLAAPDYDGIYDYVIDDLGYTNLSRITEETNATLLKGYKHDPLFSPDGTWFLYKSKRFIRQYDTIHRIDNTTRLTQTEAYYFFPASDIIVAIGFLKDTNKDKIINWKDNKQIFLYDPDGRKVLRILVEDADELLGIMNTGDYLFYRKAKSVYYKKLSNSIK